MIDWKDQHAWLLERLGRLENWKRVAFAASCAGRALPIYIAYVQRADEDPKSRAEIEQLKLGLDFVWENLLHSNSGDVSGYIQTLEAIVIEKEDNHSQASLFSESLYAAYSIMYAFQAYSSGNTEDAIGTADSNYNILHYYFNETNYRYSKNRRYVADADVGSANFIESVLSHQNDEILRFEAQPLVQIELARQRQDVTNLASATSHSFIRSLRESLTDNAVLPSSVLKEF